MTSPLPVYRDRRCLRQNDLLPCFSDDGQLKGRWRSRDTRCFSSSCDIPAGCTLECKMLLPVDEVGLHLGCGPCPSWLGSLRLILQSSPAQTPSSALATRPGTTIRSPTRFPSHSTSEELKECSRRTLVALSEILKACLSLRLKLLNQAHQNQPVFLLNCGSQVLQGSP
ncbi:Hypothetical predicted protein [Xyrichtys novacula]|uniref:Uncharacterized protein n=1 Tax=Xyrichtys novacula TaxID=13765 RepID=A0AAV1F911_XYRNO|nr:Hypothetical predicted protein [Xyrichtys novacula]